jgi:hypothetical protein
MAQMCMPYRNGPELTRAVLLSMIPWLSSMRVM